VITALLPMKANSERVPNKNFKLIGGKPLYYWILETLFAIDIIDRVIVNTDADQELFSNFVKNKKLVLRSRKPNLCGDMVSMNKIIEDDILSDEGNNFLMTHTTNPLISMKTLRNAIDIFMSRDKNQYDSLYSTTKFQGRFYYDGSVAINHNPNELLRTQDLPPVYLENSCLYLFEKSSFLETKTRIGKKPILFETPQLESVDIDTENDWYLADLLIRDKSQNK
jgi:CMP-N-acetylneuraminic acid synthetase